MFDQMSMPVLFTILITMLALVSIGVFIAVRVMAERVGAAKPTASAASSSPNPPDHPILETSERVQIDELGKDGPRK